MTAAPGRRLASWAVTLGAGVLGGGAFHLLSLPLPWMLGAMVASTLLCLSGARPLGLPPHVHPRLRFGMLAVLGVMLGAFFTPDVIADAARWMPSLSGLVGYVALVTLTVMAYFRLVPRYDRVTSYFSAAPGGLSEMVFVGAAMGGDDRVISLTHSIRIMLVVFVIPIWFRLFGDYEGGASGQMFQPAGDGLTLADAALLAASAVLGSIAAKAARLPAPTLVGPMLVSAAIHLGGLTASHPPGLLVALAQVVTGTGIGCRFAGVTWRDMRGVMGTAVGSTVVMLTVTAGVAYALAELTGLPFPALLLALSPGGLAEMCLVSLALGVDVAFVSTHHLVRILIVVILVPMLWRAFMARN